jgi:Ser-tRNA(Ala) deacylase AlaX
MLIHLLDQAIKQVCPIDGVSIGRKEDKSTWRIDFKDEATQAEKEAAQLVVDNFDINAKDPIEERIKEYGTAEEQIEYMVENGFEALKARNNLIKNKYPK